MGIELGQEQLSAVVDNIISGICIFALSDKRDIIPVYLNEGIYRMLGYTHAELEKMLKNIRRIIIPDDMTVFEQGIDDILKDDGAIEFEFRTVTGDGNIRWLQVRGNLYGKADGYPLLAGVVIDATERKSIEEQLALQAERFNILSESTKEHLLDYNSRTDVMNIRLDKSAFLHGEIVIKDFDVSDAYASIAHPDDVQFVKEFITAARLRPMSDQLDFRSNYFEKNGSKEYHWYRANITSVRGADGYVSRIVGRVVNIDEQKQRELELKRKADKDALTGLYNKGTATELIKDAIVDDAMEKKISALIMIDLDHFKSVNDTFGHAVGDAVLENAGKILSDTFKGRDIVGRMGGDEFMILMRDIYNGNDALKIAAKLNQLLTRDVSDSQGLVTVTASIGITVCDGVITDFQKLYEQADRALYDTKERGRNGRTLFGMEEV